MPASDVTGMHRHIYEAGFCGVGMLTTLYSVAFSLPASRIFQVFHSHSSDHVYKSKAKEK
jgi:peptidoglycan biosynthesis protein MviN/MurJ (putative lipid II flippase)